MTSKSVKWVSCSICLLLNVVAVEIEAMLGAAIGSEIDRVAVPHGKGVGPVGVGHVFDGVVL